METSATTASGGQVTSELSRELDRVTQWRDFGQRGQLDQKANELYSDRNWPANDPETLKPENVVLLAQIAEVLANETGSDLVKILNDRLTVVARLHPKSVTTKLLEEAGTRPSLQPFHEALKGMPTTSATTSDSPTPPPPRLIEAAGEDPSNSRPDTPPPPRGHSSAFGSAPPTASPTKGSPNGSTVRSRLAGLLGGGKPTVPLSDEAPTESVPYARRPGAPRRGQGN